MSSKKNKLLPTKNKTVPKDLKFDSDYESSGSDTSHSEDTIYQKEKKKGTKENNYVRLRK